MADHAGVAVVAAHRVDGHELDYSVATLAAVDDALDRFHREGLAPAQIGETVFSFGAYVGEVIVRHNAGSWVDLPKEHPLGEGWPMVELSNGRIVNPIGKAFKRVAHGTTESITYFYDSLVVS